MEHKIPVYLVGSGNAARAMVSALALVKDAEPGVRLGPVQKLSRGQALPAVDGPSLLLIANPHALHADLIRRADAQGFSHIVCEKPLVVDAAQIEKLRVTRAFVAVCHGYRQNWGPQRMRAAIEKGELGKLITIEGRYWQSSSAAHAVAKLPARDAWKNDTALAGHSDTLMDLGTHWADMMGFLAGARPEQARGWLSYLNAEAPHRDTHVHLEIQYPGGLRTFGSVSKTVHGAGNELEINVLTDRNAFTWKFADPDHLIIGENSTRRIISRTDPASGSGLTPFHGAGWIDGYGAILQQLFTPNAKATYPTLNEHLDLLENLFTRVKLIRT